MAIDPIDLAWADALEASVGALSHYLGRERSGDNDQETSWVAAAAFAGGLAQLAYDCEREHVPWSRLRDFALRELALISQRRAATQLAGGPSPLPTPLPTPAESPPVDWGQLPLPGLLGERRTHDAENCEAPCPLHAPSDHHMADWPLEFRPFKQIFERVCKCEVGHPDPDSLAYLQRHGDKDTSCLAEHGCCPEFCCSPPPAPAGP